MTKSNRILELDSLRGIAALAVVFYHYVWRYDTYYEHAFICPWIFSYGHLGVQFFFMISGFVIFMTLSKMNNVRDFAIARFSRLYPVYWVIVLFTFLIVSLVGLENRETTIYEALGNMLMFHPYLLIKSVDSAYWSLGVELIFYFWIAILFYFKRLFQIEIFSLLWVCIAICLYFIDHRFDIYFLGYLRGILLMTFGHLFVAGIIFYLILKKGMSGMRILILLTCLFYQCISSVIEETILVTIFFLIFILLIRHNLYFLRNRTLLFLGSISYALYLIHQNIGYVIINGLYSVGMNNPVLLIIIPLIISVCLAYLFTTYIEIPMQNKIRKYFK